MIGKWLFIGCVMVTVILTGSTSRARDRQEKEQPSVSHGRLWCQCLNRFFLFT